MRKINAECFVCKKLFYLRPSAKSHSVSGNNFCSQDCFRDSISPSKKCGICGENFRGKSRKFCSRLCSNKSRTGSKYTRESFRNRAALYQKLKFALIELRGAKCEKCDYSKVKILVIHHKIERSKGGSNDYENLEVLCPNCHAEHHYG